jgi:nucleotide-binding universal stress UspA family protein
MSGTGDDRGPVVVGFDGSAHAETAFAFAVDEALRQGVPVRVVVAHDPPDAWMSEYGMPLLADDGGIRRAVEDSARKRIEEIRSDMDAARRTVPVEVVAITGPATAVLVQEGRGATQLVVGHRGRGSLRSALLGSVGLGVLLHAPCPVTIVPPAPHAPEPALGEEAALAGPLPVGPIA